MSMKNLKVRDLPAILQTLINRTFGTCPAKPHESNFANFWLNKVDWSQCSDEERMAYAELIYGDLPIGTELKCAYDGELYTTVCKIKILDASPNIILDRPEKNMNLSLYTTTTNSWAEIISHPEEKDTERDALESATLSIKVYPDFKIGDRPVWTKELISALPHGTEIRCAASDHNLLTYIRQEAHFDFEGDLYIEPVGGGKVFFTEKDENNFAQIVSLPKQDYVANLGDIGDKKGWKSSGKVSNLHAGDLVEAWNHSSDELQEVIWTGGRTRHNAYICCLVDGESVSDLRIFKYVSKIDPEKALRDKAQELLARHANIIDAVVEALKTITP